MANLSPSAAAAAAANEVSTINFLRLLASLTLSNNATSPAPTTGPQHPFDMQSWDNMYTTSGRFESAERRLARDLFDDYDATVRPVKADRTLMSVKVGILLISLSDVVEEYETVTMKVYLGMKWFDEYLRWNPLEYENLTRVVVPNEKLWLPDVYSEEMMGQVYTTRFDKLGITLLHTGEAIWYQPMIITTHCTLNVHKFPFDVQKCKAVFLSLAYESDSITLEPMHELTECTVENAEWVMYNCTLHNFTKEYYDSTLGKQSFSCVSFHYTLRRKAGFFMITEFLPTVLISTITLLGQFSPSEHTRHREEKVTLGLTGLLSIAVILTSVSDTMPKNPAQFPIMGVFIMYEMAMCTLGTLVAVIIITVNTRYNANRAMPPSFLFLITGLIDERNAMKEETASKKMNIKALALAIVRGTAEKIPKTPMESKLCEIGNNLNRVHALLEQKELAEVHDRLVQRLFYRIDYLMLFAFMLFNATCTLFIWSELILGIE